jgi:ATP-dependent helicase/nuclease subunit A
MNIHQAKGLEATIVILAEPFGEWRPEPSIHIVRPDHGRAVGRVKVTERTFRANDTTLAAPLDWDTHASAEQVFDDAERDRLLYVAATRAERELIVGTRRGTQGDSPWRRLEPYLETYCERLDLPVTPTPERTRLETTATEMMAAVALADERRLKARAPGYRAAAVTMRVKGANDPKTPAPEQAVELRGPEWGTVVHAALEAAGRGASGDSLTAICRGLLIAAERPLDENGQPTELGELVRIVEAVTASPLWSEATAADALLLEVPFAIAVDAEDYAGIVSALPAHAAPASGAAPTEIIEGVIDLAFRHGGGGWTIVDYKSDAAGAGIGAERMARYDGQVALYAEAWRRLTGEDVSRTVLLFTADGESREAGAPA